MALRCGLDAREAILCGVTECREGARGNRSPSHKAEREEVMSRRTQTVVLVGGWIFSIALFVFMYFTYYGTKLSYSQKFPGMPFYGAMTWWFFFTIPVIGFTWGYFNDLKNRG
jgi:hypothetical protein